MRTSVLIAGAGPAGLAAAAELAFHGIPCVVVEPRSSVSMLRPRAKTTSVRTMEHFRRWGVSSAIREAAPIPSSWSDRVIFCSSLSGEIVTTFTNAFGLGSETLNLSPELGQQIPQPIVEEVLRGHLANSPFVTFRYGERVVRFTETATDVVVRVVNDDGREFTIAADYLLGCDGANSTVRKAAGIGFLGTSDARPNFNFLFRTSGLEPAVGDAVQYWIVGGSSPVVTGRLDLHGLWWVIAPGLDEDAGIAKIPAIIEDIAGHAIDYSVVSTDTWTARLLIAERYRHGRIFLVGESAHLNPPWGGHGFNTCIGDAVNLGWKLAAVLRGWATDSLLDSYESERRPIAVDTLELARHNMGALPGDLAAGAADEIQVTKDAEFHSMGIVLGYNYSHNHHDSSTYEPSTNPGSRLPHANMGGGRSLYDVLGPDFTALIPRGIDPEALYQRARAIGIPLRVIESPDSYPWGHQILMVRPDQHVASTAIDSEDTHLDALFTNAFHHSPRTSPVP